MSERSGINGGHRSEEVRRHDWGQKERGPAQTHTIRSIPHTVPHTFPPPHLEPGGAFGEVLHNDAQVHDVEHGTDYSTHAHHTSPHIPTLLHPLTWSLAALLGKSFMTTRRSTMLRTHRSQWDSATHLAVRRAYSAGRGGRRLQFGLQAGRGMQQACGASTAG